MYLSLAWASSDDDSCAEICVRRVWFSVVKSGVGGGGHGYGCASGGSAFVGEASGLALDVCAVVVVVVVLKWGSMAGDAQDDIRIVVMVVWACKQRVGGWMIAIWLSRAAPGY